MQTIKTHNDVVTFELNETDLQKSRKRGFKTPQREFRNCTWYIQWFPVGRTLFDENKLCIYLFHLKSRSVTGMMTVAPEGHPSEKKFGKNSLFGNLCAEIPHDALRPLFKDGKLTITCSVAFDFVVTRSTFQIKLHASPLNYIQKPTDFEFIGESETTERLPVHKEYLSYISPVFNAMLSHDFVENQNSQLKITDFNFGTVKTAMAFCYGQELQNPTVESVVDILRFADKYDIAIIRKKLGEIPKLSLSIENFGTVFLYAYEHSNDKLQKECFNFYKKNQVAINAKEMFAKVPITIIVNSLKHLFYLDTDFDVLRYADGVGSDFVEFLEKHLLKELTLEDFCSTVYYAWACDRTDLQKSCAAFWNANRDALFAMKCYYDLPCRVTHELSVLGYQLKYNC